MRLARCRIYNLNKTILSLPLLLHNIIYWIYKQNMKVFYDQSRISSREIESFTLKNDSFPLTRTPEFDEEDDVELAKTGFHRSEKRFERQCKETKKIDDRFRSMMLTQISPQSFRMVDVANVLGYPSASLPVVSLAPCSRSPADMDADKIEHPRRL